MVAFWNLKNGLFISTGVIMVTAIKNDKSKAYGNRVATCLDTATYWDNYGREYVLKQKSANTYSNQYIKSFYHQLVSRALGRLQFNRGLRILKVDLWNEGVETSRDILSHFENFETVGFDLSNAICHLAKDRLYNSGIVQATCQTLPFANENFDLVLDLSTIDHIPFSKTKDIFTEYYRVLKPTGLLAIAFWQSNIATKYFLHIDPEQLYFDSKKVADSLEDIGFKIVDSYDIGALLTIIDCNFWLGQFLFWRLKAAFEDKLFTSAARVEPYIFNWLGGLHVFYACHP